jgi:hypothetical protein
VEVLAHLDRAAATRATKKIGLHVISKYGAQRVPVARVEARYIRVEPRRATALLPWLRWEFLGGGKLAQRRATAVERGLDGRHAEVQQLGDLGERMIEHILQDDATALRRREL